MKKLFLISTIILFVATIIFVLTINSYFKTKNVKNENIIENKGIEVFFPKENEIISSPLKIEGFVNGEGWIGFEGQVGVVRLFDERDNELGLAILTADGEWMSRSQSDRGSSTESGQTKIDFKTTIWFDYPGDGIGKLVFYNENPSGEEERNKTFTLPVKLKTSSAAKTTFNVYFNQQPVSDCEEVFAYKREVPKTQTVATVALQELIKGPTGFEKYAGASTSINDNVKVKSVTIENGVAKVDFDAQLEAGVAGSCKVTAIRAQIEQTLKQFPTVKSVVISVDGRTEDILQP